MITKERLEELIEQGATVYELFMDKEILKVELNKNYYIMLDKTYENKLGKLPQRPHWLSDLFETKEDAEWFAEFGCIERTERLELPTYEEFLELNRHDICFSFLTKYNERYCILIGNDIYMHNDMLKPKDEWTIVIHNEDDEYIFEKPLTKENFTLACRKAKELFLGEKK